MKKLCLFILILGVQVMAAQTKHKLDFRFESVGAVGNGKLAPLWFTANRFGVNGNNNKQAFLRTAFFYQHSFTSGWNLVSGAEWVVGDQLEARFWLHQAYVDASWKWLSFSVGSKERHDFPLERNEQLGGGWMVEGPNARPIPQIRIAVNDYVLVPGTKKWIAFKAHLAYGWFTDGKWQEDFVAANQKYFHKMLYHSKSLAFRIGNKEKFPIDFEVGIVNAAQFGGEQFCKNEDGTSSLLFKKPHGLKEYLKMMIPKQENLMVNVQGNHCGSWNFALNSYVGEWKVKAYLEHYFEDHSQMFWEYGRWKDGLLGVEIVPAKNQWISAIVWEGLCTKQQTSPLLYDGVDGSFTDLQMSGGDNYYNNREYLAWQHHGATLGHPFLYGPMYNTDGSIYIKSSRVRANHLGLSGNPSKVWSWRLLASFVRHWGTYEIPLDKQRKQFSGLLEVKYVPSWINGWSFSASWGFDRGNYLGNHTGGMFSICKKGSFTW